MSLLLRAKRKLRSSPLVRCCSVDWLICSGYRPAPTIALVSHRFEVYRLFFLPGLW